MTRGRTPTSGCCQCHDHKFDPLATREYYQFFAFFNTVDEPNLELANPEQQKRRDEIQGKIAGLEKRMKSLENVTPEILEKWEDRLTAEEKAKFPKKLRD